MSDTVIPERHLTTVAADSKYTKDEIAEAVEILHDAIQSRLPTHYQSCWFKGGKNNLLFDMDGQNSSWFAFNSYDLKDELRHSDEELSDELLIYAAEANLTFFQNQLGYSVSISKSNFRKSNDPLYYPILIEKSQEWQNGFYHAMQMLKRYLFHYEMSPAEALDYWAMERVGVDTTEWSKVRRVGRAAVRKNVRQAGEKLGEDNLGKTHQENQIEAVGVDDVPDDLQDEGRVYVGLLNESGEIKLRSIDKV